MRVILSVLVLVVLSGCMHDGHSVTRSGVTAYQGVGGVMDNSVTSYQFKWCEGGKQYTNPKTGTYVCVNGVERYRYYEAENAGLWSKIVEPLAGPMILYKAMTEVGEDIGKGLGDSGNVTNVTQQGGGATSNSQSENLNINQAQGGQGGNGFGFGGNASSKSNSRATVTNPPMGGMD